MCVVENYSDAGWQKKNTQKGYFVEYNVRGKWAGKQLPQNAFC